MTTRSHLTPSEKQKRYRNRLSRKGLRPVQIWVPDTGAANFLDECRKQARKVASHAALEKNTLEFIQTVADWGDK